MLQLLEARTEKEPQQIIKSLRHVKSDIGHDYALERAWKYLDKRYSTDHSPSQHLMSAILTGPIIKWTDTNALFNLSIQCQSALDIRHSNPTTLNALDDQSTIDALVNRLDDHLRTQWMQHRRLTKPTFQFFPDWLEEWADISRINEDTCS